MHRSARAAFTMAAMILGTIQSTSQRLIVMALFFDDAEMPTETDAHTDATRIDWSNAGSTKAIDSSWISLGAAAENPRTTKTDGTAIGTTRTAATARTSTCAGPSCT